MHQTDVVPEPTFETAEVRWFGTGRLPDHVLEWFTSGGICGTESERTDSYQLNGSETRGVKLRSTALLEVKTLIGTGPVVSPVEGWNGTVEHWSKVRGSYAPIEAVEGFPFADIHKEIVTRSFRFACSHVVQIDAPDRTHAGCHVDLTALRVNGVEAWSYAFEAYGDPDVRTDALLAAIVEIERQNPHPTELPELLPDNSGYPAWIDRLARSGALSPSHFRWPTAPDASGSLT